MRERLLGCGDDNVYALLLGLVDGARRAAMDDLRLAGGARCPTCGMLSTDSPGAGPAEETLYYRGALLVRLSAPEDAEAVGNVAWGFEAYQPYWSPHIDQHNVREYDASALLYLSTCGDDFVRSGQSNYSAHCTPCLVSV